MQTQSLEHCSSNCKGLVMTYKSLIPVLFFLKVLLLTSRVKSQGYVPYIAGGLPALNGNLTHLSEFPFMAALGWMNKDRGIEFLCGGMLISSKIVLTAAHCVHRNGKLPDAVFLGGNPLTEYRPHGNSTFSIEYAITYPEYDSNQAYHDIAILGINNHRNKYEGFHPICLWSNEVLPTNDTIAIGYGLTEFAGRDSKQLLKVDLKVFPSEFCESFYKRQKKFKSGISNAHLCAGDKDEIKDTCQGDSGGPLIVKHNGRNLAVGITSEGQACSGFPPAIYTNIAPYLEWIRYILKDQDEYLEHCDRVKQVKFTNL
ncbi:serine protease snake-like [Eupeodes corollae]|uniref:serine protease snake-like n=1 Tax=Eupeodes corollae TaxID=290404 RepID=UPI002492123E|nr:serine protease snake-like [Eupeodes corollae]